MVIVEDLESEVSILVLTCKQPSVLPLLSVLYFEKILPEQFQRKFGRTLRIIKSADVIVDVTLSRARNTQVSDKGKLFWFYRTFEDLVSHSRVSFSF